MARSKNVRLKRANVETEYTPEMVKELMRCAADPIYFIKNYVYIKGKRGRMLFELHPFQENIIRQYLKNNSTIVLASRQVGKTETSAAFILWYTIFHDEKTVLIASNKSDNAKEIIGKVVFAYEELPTWLKPGADENTWNKFSLQFENRSRIIAAATSANTGRGLAIDLLYVDELAFVMPHLQEEFYTSILPTLSSKVDGKMIVSSTPNGDTNLFSQLWRGAQTDEMGRVGPNGFFPIRVEWNEPPGRDEKFKKEMIAKFGQRKWDQEFALEFLSSDHTLIDFEVLKKLEDKNSQEKIDFLFHINNQGFWKKLSKNSNYIIGVDLSEGVGGDYSVIEVFEFPSMQQVTEYRSNSTSPNELYIYLKNILRYFEHYGNEIYFSVENNAVGQAIVALYEADPNPPENSLFVSESGKNKIGFQTSSKSKIKTCVMLREMVTREHMRLYSPILIRELKSYTRQAGSYKAQIGATDDCIAATLICLRIMEELAENNDNAYHKLYSLGLEEEEANNARAIESGDAQEWKSSEGDYDPADYLPTVFI